VLEKWGEICYYGSMKGKEKAPDVPPGGFRQSLFWDVNPAVIDPDKNAVYVIERILDFGEPDEIRWMWRYYDHGLIARVVKTSRVLLPQSRSFWALMLEPQP